MRLPRSPRVRAAVLGAGLALALALVVAAAVLRPAADPTGGGAPRALASEGQESERDAETARLDGPPTTGVSAPIVETHGRAKSFDGSLRALPKAGPPSRRPLQEMGSPPDPSAGENAPDPVVQSATAEASAPAASGSFKGLDLSNWGAGWPPDTHGDVGPSHYIQAVNTSLGVFSKATGARLAAFTFDSFFAANGGTGTICDTANYGDPFVLYDRVSGRWIISDFAFSNPSRGPYYECIAVSKTGDPVSGGWWLYALVADSNNLNDYPKLGVWSDGIYMTANMFRRGSSYSGVKVWALNRDDLISGAPLRSVAFMLGTAYFSLLPANLEGASPPAGAPEYLLSDWGSTTSMRLWQMRVDWASPSSSTLTGPSSFNVASFTRPSGRVPQLGSSETVDILGDRLMTWLQYRNVGGTESLWVSRTAVAGASTGIRWYEVRGLAATPSVYQQGTYAPDSSYRWMPSIAVDKSGNMFLAYSVSSSSMYPAIRYAGRLASDPAGTLGQSEATLIAGTGSQSGGYNRWGDYASLSVDPVDDCTFWATSEYYEATGNDWQTRIGSFSLPGCGGTTTTPSVASVSLVPTSVTGGASSQGTVTLTAPAPSGGASVTLASDDAAATVPAAVTVPAGSNSAGFAVTTSPVSTATPATITATYNGTATATLTVNPATAAGGFLLSASPSSATVTGGGRGSASRTTYTVTVAPTGGFSGPVDLSLASSPSLSTGMSASLNPDPVSVSGGSATSTLTVSANKKASKGTYQLTITGSGGGTTATTTVTLVVE